MSGRPSPPVSDQQVQEDLVRLDAYRNQLNAMLQQFQYLASSRAEHLRARESLEGLDRTGPSPDLLIPVGAETFVPGTPKGESRVYLGVGSGVVVELERPKVAEILAQRVARIDQAAQELEGQMRTLEERIQILTDRLDQVAAASRGPDGAPPDDVGGD